jgi:hypothetical protein
MSSLIHIAQNNRQEGPYTLDQVQGMLDNGAITPITLAWRDGMSSWAPVSTIIPPAAPHISKAPPPLPIEKMTSPSNTAELISLDSTGPKGVGGWLLLFCVQLTILSPLISIGEMVNLWNYSKNSVVIWTSAGSLSLLIYGFIVGCGIWIGSKKGREIARKYLFVRLTGFIIIQFVAILLISENSLGPTHSKILASFIGSACGSTTTEVIYFLVWWFYFKRSKRVKNTYK